MSLEDRIRLPTLNLIQRRPRLLNSLVQHVESDTRLITVCAPGGYGKSTLLADLAQTIDLPVCWCSLEPVDRDPASFLNLLGCSVNNRFNKITPGRLANPMKQDNGHSRIRPIAGLLAKLGPHVIIIDDFHKALSEGLWQTLIKLLEQLPIGSTILVATRNEATLRVGNLIDRLSSEHGVIFPAHELRFTGEELQKLMQKRFGRVIGSADAEEIRRVTEGIIAQILLIGHAMPSESLLGRLQQRQLLGDDQATLYGYLATEYLDGQPAELQRFLLKTSVLPDMNVALCNDLLETIDAQTCLEELVHEDLFTTRVGASYRYQDLFAEYLRAKLAENEKLCRQISSRAADLLTRRDRYGEAIDLYLSSQDWVKAANLLETQGPILYERGQVLTLKHWLAQFPGEELTRYPRLLLLQGQIMVNNLGNYVQANKVFQKAEARFLVAGDKVGAAEAQVWQSVCLRLGRRADDSLTPAIAGLLRLESLQADERIIAWARRNLGVAQLRAGHRSAAVSDLSRAIEQFEATGDRFGVGKCHHDIGNCLAAQGNIGGARHHYRQACRVWRDLRNANELSTTLNSLGTTLVIIGNHKRALQYFGESLDIATESGLPGQSARALAGMGDVYLARHSLKAAREAYADSIRYAELANRPALKIYNLVKLGESYYQQQDLAKALTLANWAQELAAEYDATFEIGLVCAVMAKIFIRQQEYETSFDLSEEAVGSFAGNHILEQTKARLWWAYALLRDHRTAAAFEQLQEAVKLTQAMGQSLRGLGQTIVETRQLYDHFLHWPNTPSATRNNIRRLLERTRRRFTPAGPSLQVFTLGRPYLIIAGLRKQVTPSGGRRTWLELLAYLLIEGQDGGCRWDQVCASLWPELTPAKASITFHQALKRLRYKVFDGVDYILVQDDYYRVNPRYLQRCDALGFEELYARLATVSSAEALNLILELITLYNGQFLTGFELGEWGLSRRSSYEKRYLQLIKLASKQLLTVGEPLQALVISNQGLATNYF